MEVRLILRKNKLFIIAGIVWMFAGFMVLKTGINAFINYNSILIIILACIIFALFHFLVFSKLVRKHEKRIIEHELLILPWYLFFDKKGYIIMICMISFGIVLRKSNLLPMQFFAFFYTGLGIALFIAGISFIILSIKHKNKHKNFN